MSVETVFWCVVLARFALPLLIPLYPLPAIVGCLLLDGVDQTIFQTFGFDPPFYQSYDKAMDVFYQVRDVPGLKKKPSTSELIDWLKLLLHEDMPLEVLQSKDPSKAIPPLHGALLKNEQDVMLFERLAFVSRRSGG